MIRTLRVFMVLYMLGEGLWVLRMYCILLLGSYALSGFTFLVFVDLVSLFFFDGDSADVVFESVDLSDLDLDSDLLFL